MNPADSHNQPSFELPQPHVNGHELAGNGQTTPEKPSSAEIGKPAPAAPPVHPPIMPTLAGPVPVSSDPATHSPGMAPASSVSPAIADDVDLIEKVWVEKAKAIVAQTKDDPRRQNKEISRFKADYIKKRYNKELKVSEE
ncbi:MAG: hypothetical protein JWS12_318 [Candidatus Saccharibacteria bacterium]|nr:hypothetical protein [Candidatus Saccharibacteria bacterium]